MISYKDAKNIILKTAANAKLEKQTLPIQDCVGRICANDVNAPIDIQPFDNSAMDGFAVRLEDFNSLPVTLQKISMIAAGDCIPDVELKSGQCAEIMTGAPTMQSAEAVVPVELVEVNDDQITFKETPKMNANIRRAGEDFKMGMSVLKAGDAIAPQHVMPLAALGIDSLEVYKKPQAAFLATGNELVDDLAQDLNSGQIYNSNLPYGLAALKSMGVDCTEAPSVPDDVDGFVALLEGYMASNIDLIISSGAVSAGKFDFVREGLERIGAEILFHKVKIKPGKPNLFARLPDGTLYFGLPGNPVATTAGLRFFVTPALRAMAGLAEETPIFAKATNSFKKRAGTQMFLKSRISTNNDGLLSVETLEGQASFMVSPFLDMNCWAVVPEEAEGIKAGDDMVEIYPLYPNAGFALS